MTQLINETCIVLYEVDSITIIADDFVISHKIKINYVWEQTFRSASKIDQSIQSTFLLIGYNFDC